MAIAWESWWWCFPLQTNKTSWHQITHPDFSAERPSKARGPLPLPTNKPDYKHRSSLLALVRTQLPGASFPQTFPRPSFKSASMCGVARIAYRDCKDRTGHGEQYEVIRRCSWTRRSVREILDWCDTSPTHRPHDPEFSCVRFEHELFSPATLCPACSNRMRRDLQFEKEMADREGRLEPAGPTPTGHRRVYERHDSVWRTPPRYHRVYERDDCAWRTPPHHSRTFERRVHRTYETAKQHETAKHHETAKQSGDEDVVKEKMQCRANVGVYASTAKFVAVNGAALVVIAVGTHYLVEVFDKVCHSDKRR